MTEHFAHGGRRVASPASVVKPSRARAETAITVDALPGTSRRKASSRDPTAMWLPKGSTAPVGPTKLPASRTWPCSAVQQRHYGADPERARQQLDEGLLRHGPFVACRQDDHGRPGGRAWTAAPANQRPSSSRERAARGRP